MQNHSNQSSEVLAQRQTFQRPELKTPEKEAEWRLPGAGGRGNELLQRAQNFSSRRWKGFWRQMVVTVPQ